MFIPPLDSAELVAALPPGRFAAIDLLSAGGQGVVFRATAGYSHSRTQRGELSAFKVFVPGSQKERAEREIAALQSLSCPSLVRLVDHGVISLRGSGCLFLETTFIEGETLETRISRGPMAVTEVALLVHDVAMAIDAMWSLNIVHRDIKPANIIIQPNGHAVVIDLGVARHLDRTTLTAVNQTLGTIGYLSPEQARAMKALSCKSDIFALGVTAQHALLGRHPTHRDQGMLMNGLGGTGAIAQGAPYGFCNAIDSMLYARAFSRPLPKAVAADMVPYLALGSIR